MSKSSGTPVNVIVTDSEDTEPFTVSECSCSFCAAMHAAVKEWDTFVPETVLQTNMKKVVKKIEHNYNLRHRRC